jgi:thiol:disulfide interchange protein DsbD
VQSDRVQLGSLDLPAGEMKNDEYFGNMEVYHQDVFANLPLVRATPEAMDLDIALNYQGCAEDGICYPPTTRTLNITLPIATAVSALAAVSDRAPPVSQQSKLERVITGSSIWVTVGVFFAAGLGLAFTPCVLPMVPGRMRDIIQTASPSIMKPNAFLIAANACETALDARGHLQFEQAEHAQREDDEQP